MIFYNVRIYKVFLQYELFDGSQDDKFAGMIYRIAYIYRASPQYEFADAWIDLKF